MRTLTKTVDRRDHAKGRADAAVTIVEYGDYQCPHSARAHLVVLELLERCASDVRFVYRHFPLTQLHPHAVLAAQATEAAAAQGFFWEMHDRLFRHRRQLTFADLVEHARALELDVPRFEAALRTEMFLAEVADDFRSGVRSGVHGTPSFFVNGRGVDDWTADALTAAIRGERFTLVGEPSFTRG